MTRVFCVVLAAGSLLSATAMAAPWRPGMRTSPRHVPHPSGPGGTDGPGWSDNFNAYANGSQLIGQGGWEGWPGYANNNPTAFGSNAQASSPPISCRIALADPTASPPTDQSDFVHTYAVTGGHWQYRIKTFYPSTATNTTSPYFILLNTYVGATMTFDWSVQVHLDRATNLVIADNVGGGVVGTFTNQPLILDQWVEIVADVDLDAAPSGIVSITYGGLPLATGREWNFTGPLPGNLAAVDLYDDGVSTFYFDDASLAVVSACYPNCDHSTNTPCLNVQDFGCFLNAFAAGQSYANCDNSTSPPVLNVQDFGCFLNLFAAGCGTSC